MLKPVIYSTILILIAVACNKDNIETTPTIKIKSISPMQVPGNGDLSIMLNFTDKQGDIDSLYLYKIRTNQDQRKTQFDSILYKIPEFPEKSKGEIKITIQYNFGLLSAETPPAQPGAPNGKEPDTLIFKMYAKDRAKNASDTVFSEPVVVERF
jgi:hypothetical protein